MVRGADAIPNSALLHIFGSRHGLQRVDVEGDAVIVHVLIPAAQNNVSAERVAFLVCDQLNCLSLFALGLGESTPDDNMIRLLPERLSRCGTPDRRCAPVPRLRQHNTVAAKARRSKANEERLPARGLISKIHCKKPRGWLMPERIRRRNATKSKMRPAAEHVFAQQRDRMGVFIRIVGIEDARAKVDLASIA